MVIEVRDDGRGMDPDALRASVVRKGLMDAGAAAALTDEQALELVFLPGFSTAAQTTDVSGRGVGMDAVRNAIADLQRRGRDRERRRVAAAVFTIRLPLTLAIIQALLVSRPGPAPAGSGHVWAVPLEAIEETVIVDPRRDPPGRRPPVHGAARHASSRSCGCATDCTRRAGARRRRRAARRGRGAQRRRRASAWWSTASPASRTSSSSTCPDYLGDVSGVAGATILGDGSVALIVNVAARSPGVRAASCA